MLSSDFETKPMRAGLVSVGHYIVIDGLALKIEHKFLDYPVVRLVVENKGELEYDVDAFVSICKYAHDGR